MPAIDITVNHPSGLHARPASKFVRAAAAFICTIRVCNVTSGGEPVNAKSILSVLTLGVNQGNQVRIEAEGDQAEQAIVSLVNLIKDNFGESAA
jgi:phosphotransferase system HPr (HPr) family protein